MKLDFSLGLATGCAIATLALTACGIDGIAAIDESRSCETTDSTEASSGDFSVVERTCKQDGYDVELLGMEF